MKKAISILGLITAGTAIAIADDVTGENELLCAPGWVTHCSSGGDCDTAPSENFGIPSFLRIDLRRETIQTSEASEEDLSTPIQSVTRGDGEVYLQGVENMRMFSILIDEASGDGSMAIIADGETATAFLACTVD